MYATLEQLGYSNDLLLWLTGAPAGGLLDDMVVEDALATASRRIDQYLAQRYRLPWDDSAGQLRDLCVALARYHLYTLRPDGPEVPAVVKDGRDQAERDLRLISEGRLSLAGASLAEDNPIEPPKAVVSAGARRFDRDTLARW
jgi:phage gp36-like protein